MKTTVLVTGGAGFIGSHLAESVLGTGRDVIVLDDLSTGRLDNLRDIAADPRFRFVEGSVLDRALVEDLVGAAEEVYHLAGIVGVKLVIEDPIRTVNVNVAGTENVLRACMARRRRVLVASTSEVYGRDCTARARPFREDDDLSLGTALRWTYACSKAMDEYLALSYARKQDLPVVVVRLFNTVGPRQTGAYGMVIPRFVEQALAAEPITVYGDGEQVRSFLLVDDAVRAVQALMAAPAALGKVFNVGSERPVRIIDLAQRVRERAGSASPVVLVPYDRAYGDGFEDIRFRVPDTAKIREAIGFHPSCGLDDILDRVIAYHRTLAAGSP